MSDHLDRTDRHLHALHTRLGERLDVVLDLDSGLREVLVAARHRDLGDTLDRALDVDAGLRAIVPTAEPPAPDPLTSAITEADGAVAAWLMSLDTQSRLAVRTHPALDALAVLFILARVSLSASTLERTPDFDRVLARDLARARVLARDLDLALDFDHSLALDFDRDLDRALDLARGLALTSDLDRVLARDLALARTFARTFAHASVFDRVLDRVFALDRGLDRARHDFTTADLRGIDLTHVPLEGLRWSTATQWPSQTWKDQALHDSTEIEPGIYEIRSGTTNVPTHIS